MFAAQQPCGPVEPGRLRDRELLELLVVHCTSVVAVRTTSCLFDAMTPTECVTQTVLVEGLIWTAFG